MPEPDVKHESARIDPRPILWTAAAMIATAVVLHFALAGLQGHLQRREAGRAAAAANPFAAARSAEPTDEQLAAVPPPRLEGLERLRDRAPATHTALPAAAGNSPEFHPEDLRPENWSLLNGYAWVDKDRGVARIPIGEAMAALLKSGRLKVQPGRETARPPAAGAGRALGASSGRPPGEGRP